MVLIDHGRRGTGKTAVLHRHTDPTRLNLKLLAGDDVLLQDTLGSQDAARLRALVEAMTCWPWTRPTMYLTSALA
jgi:hypothetical protein